MNVRTSQRRCDSSQRSPAPPLAKHVSAVPLMETVTASHSYAAPSYECNNLLEVSGWRELGGGGGVVSMAWFPSSCHLCCLLKAAAGGDEGGEGCSGTDCA